MFEGDKAFLLFPVNQLLVKNDYILPLDIYRHHKTNISPNWRDIENLGNRSLKKIANALSVPTDYFTNYS